MHFSRLLGLFGLTTAIMVAGAAACSDGDGGSGGTGTGTSAGGNGGNTGGGGEGGTNTGTATGGGDCMLGCTSPDPAHEGIDYTVSGDVTGTIVDQNNNVADDVITDVCGTNLCLFGEADAQGSFVVPGMDSLLSDVRLLYGNGKRFAKMGTRLPTCDAQSCVAPTFGTINTIALPDIASGAEMVAGTDVMQGNVTLSIPAEACIKHDKILYDDAELGFRSIAIDYPASGLNLPAVDQANFGNSVIIVATAPINTVVCPAAAATFDNVANFADGDVDIYFHGTKTFQHYAPYGEWTLIGEGTVSGGTITTKAGSEIEMLGVFALVPK